MSLFDESHDDLSPEQRTDRLFDDISMGLPAMGEDELTRQLARWRYEVQETPLTREVVTDDEARITMLIGQIQYQPVISLRLLCVTVICAMIGLICIILLFML
jgi:hypothetical protein